MRVRILKETVYRKQGSCVFQEILFEVFPHIRRDIADCREPVEPSAVNYMVKAHKVAEVAPPLERSVGEVRGPLRYIAERHPVTHQDEVTVRSEEGEA